MRLLRTKRRPPTVVKMRKMNQNLDFSFSNKTLVLTPLRPPIYTNPFLIKSPSNKGYFHNYPTKNQQKQEKTTKKTKQIIKNFEDYLTKPKKFTAKKPKIP